MGKSLSAKGPPSILAFRPATVRHCAGRKIQTPGRPHRKLVALNLPKPQWRTGDVLLISTNDVSLNAFIDKHVENGWITAVDKIGCFTGYSVHEIHDPASLGTPMPDQ